jgi:hypothetical protein
MKLTAIRTPLLLAAVVLVGAQTAAPVVADDDLPLRMRAFAGAQTRGRTSIVEISVNEWTTPEERQMLIEFMRQEGTLGLRDKLQELSTKGHINAQGQMGIDWRYAYRIEKAGGSTIVLGADRPVNVQEAIDRGATSRAYNVTMAVIELDESGKGAGTLFLAAELGFDADGRLRVTGVGQNPVHLGDVQLLQKKKKK